MLSLLLDENISDEIASQLNRKRSDIPIISLYRWQEGRLLDTDDAIILRAAAQASLTLVTYDRTTIPPLLVRLAAEGFSHGGVIFVDHNTISSNDFGGLVRSLIAFWDDKHEFDWENRVDYLRAAPR